MFSRLFVFSALALASVSVPSLASEARQSDGAFLDPRYPSIRHPRAHRFDPSASAFARLPEAPALHSDVETVIAQQTPVKMQGSRGTCSIFASTALLEAMLIKKGDFDTTLDLSEEWLEFLVTRNRASDGSSSSSNFRALLAFGSPMEATLPYIGETWDNADSGLAAERCGKLEGPTQKSCLIAHWDPSFLKAEDDSVDPGFLKARQEAQAFHDKYLAGHENDGGFALSSEDEVKDALRKGYALTLDLDFYYGAWNHRVGPSLGIPRDLDHWEHGIIGYPEPGSVDRANSGKDPAGHAVVVVGYDDEAEVTVDSLMADGTTQKFTYKGVYYFKNSWGTENFGRSFEINGVAHPGYGMITQKYAHELGGFYKLSLE